MLRRSGTIFPLRAGVVLIALAFAMMAVISSAHIAAARDGALLVNPRDFKQKEQPSKKAATPAPKARKAVSKPPAPRKTIRRTQRRVQARSVPRETAPSGQPPADEARFINDQVIVRYRLSAAQSSMDALVRRLNLRHLDGATFRLAGITVHLYEIADGSPVRQVIAALENDATVVYAQPNYIYELQQDSASGGPQYALARMAVDAAHKLTRGADVPVAVIDSAVDSSHPEFNGTAIETADVTGKRPAPHQHGSTIAALIASKGTLVGIAPDVRLLGITAFDVDSAGNATSSSWAIASAIDMAEEWGARIVNMSFAGPKDPLIERSSNGMARRKMIAVAAAGNAGPKAAPLYPAAYDTVVAVTATDRSDAVFDMANQGAYVALAAPGVDILGIAPGGRYAVSSGTSLAAAHISGLAALILGRADGIDADDLLEALISTSRDLGDPGVDPVFGAGLPDAQTAIVQVGS